MRKPISERGVLAGPPWPDVEVQLVHVHEHQRSTPSMLRASAPLRKTPFRAPRRKDRSLGSGLISRGCPPMKQGPGRLRCPPGPRCRRAKGSIDAKGLLEQTCWPFDRSAKPGGDPPNLGPTRVSWRPRVFRGGCAGPRRFVLQPALQIALFCPRRRGSNRRFRWHGRGGPHAPKSSPGPSMDEPSPTRPWIAQAVQPEDVVRFPSRDLLEK
ncbi:MAG: hypothetical protein CM15mP18_3030 [Methanobacteriota archaeon]|nr:MAG: hypothetical protein CM15mP18_3030 [Euryarchaeota archaeon]